MMQKILIFFINEIFTSKEKQSLENQSLVTQADIQNPLKENSMTCVHRKKSKEERPFLFKKRVTSSVEIELETLKISTEPSTSSNTETTRPFLPEQVDNEINVVDNTTKNIKNKISFCTFFMERGETYLLILTSILIIGIVLIIVLCVNFYSASVICIMVLLVVIFLSTVLFFMVSEWNAERKR